MAKFYNIEKIRLQNNNISDISIMSQLNFKNLRELDLSHNIISNIDSLSYLRLNSLRKIVLSDNSFVIDSYKGVLDTLKRNNIEIVI